MTPDKIADKVAKEIDKICQKYNCEIGVWLTWRDLINNFDIMKKNAELNELQFGLQIRLEDGVKDKNKTRDEGAA
jgi:hypothetical protein